MARKKANYTPPKTPSLWPRRLIVLVIVGLASFSLWQQRETIQEFVRRQTPVVQVSAQKAFTNARSFLTPYLQKTKELTNSALQKFSDVLKQRTAFKIPEIHWPTSKTPTASKQVKTPDSPKRPSANKSNSPQSLQPTVQTEPSVIDYSNVTRYHGPPKDSNPQEYRPRPLKRLEIITEPPTQESVAATASPQITIASFNIRIFSDKSRTDKELMYIAHILKRNDITAIQELRDENVLKRTLSLLEPMGYPFAYEISPPVGREVKERYAFVYRRDKIALKETGQLYPMTGAQFIREPYYASFQADNFDFTLLTIHVLYGKSEQDRRPELGELAKAYQYVQNADPSEQDVIVLGDFNFDPEDYGWENLKRFETMTSLLKTPTKTTISDTKLYDNFWFQRKYVKEYIGQTGVVKFDENIFNNDDEKAELAVSDHRPIWARFNVTLGDDD